MTLYIRMFLYLIFGWLAGQGFILMDDINGTISVRVDDISLMLSGLLGFIGTYIGSRIAKARGGKT